MHTPSPISATTIFQPDLQTAAELLLNALRDELQVVKTGERPCYRFLRQSKTFFSLQMCTLCVMVITRSTIKVAQSTNNSTFFISLRCNPANRLSLQIYSEYFKGHYHRSLCYHIPCVYYFRQSKRVSDIIQISFETLL